MNAMKQWLRRHTKEENTELARKAGTSLMYLEHIGMGLRTPGRKLAEKIEAATDGGLNKVDLLFPDG